MKVNQIIDELYSRDNVALRNYMRNDIIDDFDAEEYWPEICELISMDDALYRKLNGIDDELDQYIDDDDVPYHYLMDTFWGDISVVWDRFTTNEKQQLMEDALSIRMGSNPEEADTRQHMSLSNKQLLNRQTWLVHFSEHADDISMHGFKYGVDQMDRLGLTTWLGGEMKDSHGFNFAFEADSDYTELAARKWKYGPDAVLFQNSGVKAYHAGDEEDQVMFYGKDVSPNQLVWLSRDYGDWGVMAKHGKHAYKPIFQAEQISDVIDWVKQNHQQYRNIIY